MKCKYLPVDAFIFVFCAIHSNTEKQEETMVVSALKKKN